MFKKVNTILVDSLPYRSEMEEDTIYVSERSLNATHLDFLGTGEEIMTPFIRGGYFYNLDENDEVSIFPQIYNEEKQLYYIKNGYAFTA